MSIWDSKNRTSSDFYFLDKGWSTSWDPGLMPGRFETGLIEGVVGEMYWEAYTRPELDAILALPEDNSVLTLLPHAGRGEFEMSQDLLRAMTHLFEIRKQN